MADIDIVDRLTGTRWHGTPFGQDAMEAAAEIERLREQHDRLKNALQTIHDTFARDHAQGFKTRDKQFAIDVAWPVLCR